jgi:hypothetical protein
VKRSVKRFAEHVDFATHYIDLVPLLEAIKDMK